MCVYIVLCMLNNAIANNRVTLPKDINFIYIVLFCNDLKIIHYDIQDVLQMENIIYIKLCPKFLETIFGISSIFNYEKNILTKKNYEKYINFEN